MKPYGLQYRMFARRKARRLISCKCCPPNDDKSDRHRERQRGREEVAEGLRDERPCPKCLQCWESGKARGCCSYQSGPKELWICMSCDCFDAQEFRDRYLNWARTA